MANDQPTDAHLRVAHRIGEQLMVSHFSEQQRRILDLILRLSWGCGKKEAIIPRQRDFEIVGVLEGHIKAHIDWLIEAKVIQRDGDQYSFNKDYDQWRVSRAFHYSQEKLTELVRFNLNGTYGKGKQNKRKTYGKGKKPLTEKVSSPDTNSASPKESIKESIKESSHALRISSNPHIARMQNFLGFPEAINRDPVPNPAKEANFIKKMLDRGFDIADIFACWESKVKARGEFVSMVYVNEDIGKKGGNHGKGRLPGINDYETPEEFKARRRRERPAGAAAQGKS